MPHTKPGDYVAVTGATGFVGRTLVEFLWSSGYKVIGISERPEPPVCIAHMLDEYHCADLTQGWPPLKSFAGLIHLAGLAAVGPSFDHPQMYIENNSAMMTHIFESVLADKWRGRAIVVSSGAVYRTSGGERHEFIESSPVASTSPYVVSKLLVENQAEYYKRRGLDILVARPFNHIGPGQREGFILPDLFRKVSMHTSRSAMAIGNLDSSRDYTDVRDIVRAYILLLECAAPRYWLYNVCSGAERSGWDILTTICRFQRKAIPPTRREKSRAIDPLAIKGNAERLRAETGWIPSIQFETSIRDFIRSVDDCGY